MALPRLALIALLLAPATTLAGPDFEAEVAPVLLRRCLECHSGADPSGKLDLSTAAGLAKGGRSGPAAESIVEKVTAGEMPPKKGGKPQPLPKAEVESLRAWVAAGTPWPKGRTLDRDERTTDARGGRDWWAFQPVRRPAVSPGHANPIDAFVRARLTEKGWAPAPPADPRALLRRLTFDLTGLPPTAEELDAFAADPSPAAYEKAVDKLLSSPHHGERWARHWLDVARYAETCGYERDQTKPHAWKYRDWVVAAFNADKPFARFVREQLAGDELPDRSEETVTATGFLRVGTWNDEPNDPDEYTYERLEDLVGATTTAFLAVTVKCARCHDHKFDPVPQRDYYRLAAAFWSGPVKPGPRELLGGPTKEQLGYDLLGWTDTSATPPPLRLLKKGDPARPGEPVPFGLLSLAPSLDMPVVPPKAGAKTTGRRLALADWIADPKNPLAARVWVNRLWQHHFGAGLVRSPDNFGFTGEKPTHPELLDWLAAEFVANGGRSKPLHRLMVLSEAYKQASVHPKQAEYAAVDAGNRLWWRAERRRLDAESLRDALLAASGRLDLPKVGGPSFVPDISPEALEGWSRKGAEWTPSPADEQRRRTLYAFVKRGLLPPTLTVFDAPDTTLPCAKRDVTTVAPQALALLNNPFVHQQSEALAARAGAGDDPVRRAWRSALGRDPRPAERAAADRHLADQTKRLGSADKALASLCHVLLNTNEFVYLD
ncbi:MAG: PSD1 and planctomycete cytochrome C domain-containing protein [Gemmataceae bacterium]|nr:PSD1 and planctomycete cytochrome C domain-containing protein [Gemmataceae bacterium]